MRLVFHPWTRLDTPGSSAGLGSGGYGAGYGAGHGAGYGLGYGDQGQLEFGESNTGSFLDVGNPTNIVLQCFTTLS